MATGHGEDVVGCSGDDSDSDGGRSRSRSRTPPQKRLQKLAEELVKTKDRVDTAVRYLKPQIQTVLHKVRAAEIAVNKLAEVSDDIKNMPTIINCLKLGTNRVLELEGMYEDTLDLVGSSLRPGGSLRTVVRTTTTTLIRPHVE